MQIVHREEIERALETVDLISTIESGFVDYSAGRAVVPPVGELLLPGGEVHIKYGYIQGDTGYVVKIASGFPGNRARGLPANSGLMLAFDQASGVPTAILLDEGLLTDVRTAVAGAVAARHLAPQRVDRIGIVGTGVQARLQLQHLEGVTACRDVVVWGRNREEARRYVADMAKPGFRVEVAPTAADLAARCELIVTTTAATEPLLRAKDLRPGTHISAIGSDTEEKQELAADVLERADVVVADSRAQCTLRGEVARAIEKGALTMDRVAEIGEVIAGRAKGRTATDQITVFDSTGVAVQDIRIAAAVLRGLGRSG